MIARQRYLVCIKFIGELFKYGMMSVRIMHSCTMKFLDDGKNPSEVDMEALCILLTTIGKRFNVERKAHEYSNAYFAHIGHITQHSHFPARIKFMLADLVDLRNRDWVPRNFQEREEAAEHA
jgi:translation initiation factor 4G